MNPRETEVEQLIHVGAELAPPSTAAAAAAQSPSGLMLDARRTQPQLPLMREVTALQKIRTLQDPGTSSSVTSGGSSAGRRKKVKTQTFIGDPQRDAQALAVELSGKLAKSANVLSLSDGGSSRARKPSQRKGDSKNIRVDKLQKRGVKKMTAEEETFDGEDDNRQVNDSRIEPMKVDVEDRIKRIESAFQGSTGTLSGELRKDGLIKELKARERRDASQQLDEGAMSDGRWEGKPARREDLARRVIEERAPSVSSLSQLLGSHQYGSGRSTLNLLAMVEDEERRHNFDGESLFESDQEELSPMEIEMSRAHEASPRLHRESLSRGKEDLHRKPRSRPSRGRKKPGSARARERSVNLARPRSGKSSARLMGVKEPPASIILNDELAVSELPAQNGCGIGPWDWSRIHKYGGKAFLDLTGLTCTLPESKLHGMDVNVLMAEQNPPVQSISSLDSDANALPLIIGEDAHDSDLAGYYIEMGRAREVPQKLKGAGKRKASLQNAVRDVPVVDAGTSTNSEGHRTLTQKYRPKNFKEIVGQAVVVKSLSTAILKSKVAPVYLFMGPRGTGKTSAARVFAAGLNCLSLDYGRRPCGICRECGTMALNRSADVRQIDAASNADMASLRAMMGSFIPHARYKVFIVEGCDLLTTDIWNAFLKVLEEPPRNVVFILITTDAERIPPNAASRCQKFYFSKVKESDIVRRLELLAGKEGLRVEAGALSLIASRSDGSLRDAEIVLDQLCLLDKNVTIALVQELVGLLPDNKIVDLLDYALSADTVNTVRTMREVLATGVEPLSLVAQLGALITDILVGSYDVHQDSRKDGFFNRDFSVKEVQHRLRQALKILSEAEKQLRLSTDRATWLTAALLQFAPDRSFLPSEANTSLVPSPVALQSSRPAADHSDSREQQPLMDESDDAQAPEPVPHERALRVYAESKKNPIPPEAEAAASSELKLEEAWAREPHQQVSVEVSVDEDGEPPEARPAPETSLDFQVFGDEALAELWKRVVWEVTPRNLKHLLQTHGRLVAAGVAVVVELQFDYARDKHKAERSWRSICIAFQAVLSTAVELRIAMSDFLPEDPEAVRTGETMVDMQPGPSAQLKNKEIVDEDASADANVRGTQGAPPRGRRRRGAKSRKHRHANEMLENELGAAQESSEPTGITPRRLPPSRRRRVKRTAAAKPAMSVSLDIGMDYRQGSSSFGGEIWDSGKGSVGRRSNEKKLLSTMIEEPQSEIEDLQSAQKKILKQRAVQFRNNTVLISTIERRNSLIADLQRGLPMESSMCWKKETPQSDFLMRKSRVKSVRKAQGKALFLSLVPCRESNIATNAVPASTAHLSASKAA